MDTIEEVLREVSLELQDEVAAAALANLAERPDKYAEARDLATSLAQLLPDVNKDTLSMILAMGVKEVVETAYDPNFKDDELLTYASIFLFVDARKEQKK
jgi:hypothetical protein